MNEGGHPVNQLLQKHPYSPSSVPLELEANSITSPNGNASVDNNIQPLSATREHSESIPVCNDQPSLNPATEVPRTVKSESFGISDFKTLMEAKSDSPSSSDPIQTAEATTDVKCDTSFVSRPNLTANAKTDTSSAVPLSKTTSAVDTIPTCPNEPELHGPCPSFSEMRLVNEKGGDLKNGINKLDFPRPPVKGNINSKLSFLLDDINFSDGNESGTEEEQSVFMKQLEIFFKERGMEFKPPKFYGKRLWRAVTKLGGYDKVTSCKLWRQVGESFKPPKTCTTVSWTFRGFYEKALLDYERHRTCGVELNIPIASQSEPMNVENQASGSGRARRDAAARAMQGWHSQHHNCNGEVSDPIITDKNSIPLQKRTKQLKSLGLLKRKKPSYLGAAVKATHTKVSKSHVETAVVDIGPAADWVKIYVRKTVRVQSDPAGRLVISGNPEHPDNPWGVTPFKKVVSLPLRIDLHRTSAVVTFMGSCLYVFRLKNKAADETNTSGVKEGVCSQA